MVPRRSTRIVLVDEDETLAHRAAAKLQQAGYRDVSVLAGGQGSWKAAGYEIFSGVNVPSKAFGEIVEHACETPRLEASEIQALMDAGTDMVVLDSRPWPEYVNMSIPTGIDCPGRNWSTGSTTSSGPRTRWSSSTAPAAPAASSARSR